jgi:hypothetical protein
MGRISNVGVPWPVMDVIILTGLSFARFLFRMRIADVQRAMP